MNLRPRIVRNQEWDGAFSKLYSLDLCELILCLLRCNAVNGEAALGIIHETEAFASLVDSDHIHESGWIGCIRANFAVDFDETLHDNGFCFPRVQSVL